MSRKSRGQPRVLLVDDEPDLLELLELTLSRMGLDTTRAETVGEAIRLLDELIACVQSYQPPGAMASLTAWTMIQQQIEEPSTVLQLYEEVLSLHLGFSIAATLSEYREMAAKMMAATGPITSTSTEDAPSSSPAASPA